MRYIFSFLLVAALAGTAAAQNTVQARDIIRDINNGKSISYRNVEIVGDLDLTDLNNRREKHSGGSWFNWDNDLYESTVEVSMSFVNCVFADDVIAYYNDERSDDTFIAHFDKDAVFKDCTFRRASEFKYTEFGGIADFSGSTFNRLANFKYAEFSEAPSYAHVKFEDDADFKYTEFPRGTTFENSSFYGLANFKYSKFRTPLNLKNVAFKGDEDFKYTKVDGESFTSYLLENR